jgi:hypothetical protein
MVLLAYFRQVIPPPLSIALGAATPQVDPLQMPL